MAPLMPFGSHRGRPIGRLSTTYLIYLRRNMRHCSLRWAVAVALNKRLKHKES